MTDDKSTAASEPGEFEETPSQPEERPVREVRRTEGVGAREVRPRVEKRWCVYQLLDPRTGETRYVGRTSPKNARNRRTCHELTERDDGSQHYRNWKKSVGRSGLRPVFEVLTYQDSEEDNHAAEQYAIGLGRALGCRLLNVTNGGDGPSGLVLSAESRAKIGAASRTPGRIAILVERNRRMAADPAFLAALSDRGRAAASDPQVRARLGVIARERCLDPEYRARLSDAQMASVARRDAEDPGWRERSRAARVTGEPIYASDGRCFVSLHQAERETGVGRDTISKDLRGAVRLKMSTRRIWFSRSPETATPLVLSGVAHAEAWAARSSALAVCDEHGNTYPSISAAASATNCCAGGIRAVLRGEQRHTSGHTFRYAHEAATTIKDRLTRPRAENGSGVRQRRTRRKEPK